MKGDIIFSTYFSDSPNERKAEVGKNIFGCLFLKCYKHGVLYKTKIYTSPMVTESILEEAADRFVCKERPLKI